MTEIIRQGDIIFKRVDEKPINKELKKLTIAEGEITGHHHILIAETDSVILGDRTLFTVKGKAKLIHPEHDTIVFPEGTYMVSNEREWDYINLEMTKVRD